MFGGSRFNFAGHCFVHCDEKKQLKENNAKAEEIAKWIRAKRVDLWTKGWRGYRCDSTMTSREMWEKRKTFTNACKKAKELAKKIDWSTYKAASICSKEDRKKGQEKFLAIHQAQ